MLGMEQMLAKMIGMTPEEMQVAATQVKDGLLSVAQKLDSIDKKCDLILARLEEENEPGAGKPNGNGRNRRAAIAPK